MTFINNVKAVFNTSADEKTRDSGELVSTIIMIAGFAIMSLLAVNWLSTSVLKKAADSSACIESSNAYTDTASTAGAGCTSTAGGLKSFKTDKGYIGRST